MRTLVSSADPGPGEDVLRRCFEKYAEELSDKGYTVLTMREKRREASAFIRWIVRQRLDVARIDENTVGIYLTRGGLRPPPRRGQRRTLTSFLGLLRAEGVTSSAGPGRSQLRASLPEEEFAAYLRSERALNQQTIVNYRRYVSEFVATCRSSSDTTPGFGPSAQAVKDFLLERSRGLAPGTTQHIATALRSFLRFLFLRGDTPTDLSHAIPAVPRWRLAKVHPFLRPGEVDELLEACDRETVPGRRDHAILLLLARLGLRACEVAALKVGDLRWRSGEIEVHGKGGSLHRLPLLPEVGAAVAAYLRHGRPRSRCRYVFLRIQAPHVGLGADAIGLIVRRALARAGLRPSRCGSHLLRFSLATAMIRSGASMAEIAEILGHRSPETTEIYAKVDFVALRTVAIPWPGSGGAQ